VRRRQPARDLSSADVPLDASGRGRALLQRTHRRHLRLARRGHRLHPDHERRRLLELERGLDFTHHGKTGLGFLDGRAIGWLVGYVQRGGRRWIYATFVRSRAGADVRAEATRLTPLRERITRALLTKAGVLRAE
jgi:beta-lactamase class D